MKPVQLVLIGAGSTVFTPGLVADVARSPHLRRARLALVDINPAAVEVMTALARRIGREAGADLEVVGTTDRRSALPGADAVVTTIAVGGIGAWRDDVRLAERHGIWQTVGDSVGPGGVFRALRHIPALVGIARDMEELCPAAWLLNYSNPLSPNVRAVHRATRIRCVGLCTGSAHTRDTIARALRVPAGELAATFAGINHLTWLLSLRRGGVDLYPRWRALVDEGPAGGSAPNGADVYEGYQPVSARLMHLFGLYPAPGDRHVAEFFPYFLRRDGDSLAYGLQAALCLTNDALDGKSDAVDRIRAQAAGAAPLPDWLFDPHRPPELAVRVLESTVAGESHRALALNVRNGELIPNLPPEAVVEVPGIVDGDGPRGVPVGPLPAPIADVLRARVAQQELVVEAALTGARDRALQALVADPLVRDFDAAEALLDAALRAEAPFLPQFGASGPARVA